MVAKIRNGSITYDGVSRTWGYEFHEGVKEDALLPDTITLGTILSGTMRVSIMQGDGRGAQVDLDRRLALELARELEDWAR